MRKPTFPTCHGVSSRPNARKKLRRSDRKCAMGPNAGRQARLQTPPGGPPTPKRRCSRRLWRKSSHETLESRLACRGCAGDRRLRRERRWRWRSARASCGERRPPQYVGDTNPPAESGVRFLFMPRCSRALANAPSHGHDDPLCPASRPSIPGSRGDACLICPESNPDEVLAPHRFRYRTDSLGVPKHMRGRDDHWRRERVPASAVRNLV